MTRKIVIILCVIVVLFLIILGVLFFLSRTTPSADESPLITKVRDIFPFGQPVRSPDDLFPGDDTPITTPSTQTTGNVDAAPIPRLRKISERPTAGSIIWTETEGITRDKHYHIRYADRATGHIFETDSDSLAINRISNTTLPKMYEAKFASSTSFIARFLDDNNGDLIKTYFIALKNKPVVATTTASSTPVNVIPKESIGTYLDENIKEFALSPSKNKMLYSLYTETGGTLISANTTGTGKRSVYASPLREWLLDWQNESTALITTKPSGLVDGFAYLLNTSNGALTKVIGNVTGLTMLAKPNSNSYLYGRGGGNITLFSLRKDPTGDKLITLTETLPEKCVWSKRDAVIIYCGVPQSVELGIYPDDWYQGRVSFTDLLWRINIATGQTNLVMIPERESGESIDMMNLEIAEDDTYLTFINKKDLSLWGYQIEYPARAVTFAPAATTTATSSAR